MRDNLSLEDIEIRINCAANLARTLQEALAFGHNCANDYVGSMTVLADYLDIIDKSIESVGKNNENML